MAKNGYDGLCKKLVGAIATRQETRRGQGYERVKHGIIESFTEALKELRDIYHRKASIEFLTDLACGAVELTKKQIYDKIRWLVKKAEISTEYGNRYYHRWHKYGDGTAKKMLSQSALTFLEV